MEIQLFCTREKEFWRVAEFWRLYPCRSHFSVTIATQKSMLYLDKSFVFKSLPFLSNEISDVVYRIWGKWVTRHRRSSVSCGKFCRHFLRTWESWRNCPARSSSVPTCSQWKVCWMFSISFLESHWIWLWVGAAWISHRQSETSCPLLSYWNYDSRFNPWFVYFWAACLYVGEISLDRSARSLWQYDNLTIDP